MIELREVVITAPDPTGSCTPGATEWQKSSR